MIRPGKFLEMNRILLGPPAINDGKKIFLRMEAPKMIQYRECFRNYSPAGINRSFLY